MLFYIISDITNRIVSLLENNKQTLAIKHVYRISLEKNTAYPSVLVNVTNCKNILQHSAYPIYEVFFTLSLFSDSEILPLFIAQNIVKILTSKNLNKIHISENNPISNFYTKNISAYDISMENIKNSILNQIIIKYSLLIQKKYDQ